MTDDGDEPEKVGVTELKTPKEHIGECLYGEFKGLTGDCVCHEEGTNFVGETFARADNVANARVCQKLCKSQINCEYWSHHTEQEKTCLLKNKISAISRESDNPESANFVSGTKNCNIPITKGIILDSIVLNGWTFLLTIH